MYDLVRFISALFYHFRLRKEPRHLSVMESFGYTYFNGKCVRIANLNPFIRLVMGYPFFLGLSPYSGPDSSEAEESEGSFTDPDPISPEEREKLERALAPKLAKIKRYFDENPPLIAKYYAELEAAESQKGNPSLMVEVPANLASQSFECGNRSEDNLHRSESTSNTVNIQEGGHHG